MQHEPEQAVREYDTTGELLQKTKNQVTNWKEVKGKEGGCNYKAFTTPPPHFQMLHVQRKNYWRIWIQKSNKKNVSLQFYYDTMHATATVRGTAHQTKGFMLDF